MTDEGKPCRRWWEAHNALVNGHQELTKRVDIHQEAIKHLGDAIHDNHTQVMIAIQKVDTGVHEYINARQKLTPGQALALFGVFFLLVAAVIGIYAK